MLDGKEGVCHAMTLFKEALKLEKNNFINEAIYQYGSVLDMYYLSHHKELKDICLYAIRSLLNLSKQTNYREPGILMALHHSERLPWHFENEKEYFNQLIIVEVLCTGIYLCFQTKNKNELKARKMFNYLKAQYKHRNERKIKNQIIKITQFMKEQKKEQKILLSRME